MKFLLIASCATLALAAPKNLEIFWITSVDQASRTGSAGFSEREIIPNWRNRWVVPYWDAFMSTLKLNKVHWIQYGDQEATPCFREVLTTDNWADLKSAFTKTGTNPDTDLTVNSKSHVGWDALAYATTLKDSASDVRVYVWENYVSEQINVSPYPSNLDLNEQCGADATGGHVSTSQFATAFKSRNDRIWLMNYDSQAVGTELANQLKTLLPNGKTYSTYWATAGDPNMVDTTYWNTYANTVTLNAQLFFATGALPETLAAFPDVNFEDETEAKKWLDEYWPMFLEVYGKEGTKGWKSKFYLPDDHPENQA